MSPARASIRPFEQAYTTGLLALQYKTLAEMREQQVLPFSRTHSADLLAQDRHPHRAGLIGRLKEAPAGGILAVDLLPVKHEGPSIQGVGRVYSSTDNGVVWGHALVSSALVFPDQDPFPLQLAPFPTPQMATSLYPRLSATEGMLTIVGDVMEAGYKVEAVVFDAQFTPSFLPIMARNGLRKLGVKFTTRLGLRSLKFMPVAFVGRCRTDAWVYLGREHVQVRSLAERFPPGKSRWYKRFGWYAKIVEVWLEEVGRVDLVLVWKAKGEDWECFALLSSVQGGVQQVLNIWQLRWDLELSHRLYKQNLGLGKCMCRRFSSQLKHADLVLDAFLIVRAHRASRPDLSWRRAQEQAALTRRNPVLTGMTRIAA